MKRAISIAVAAAVMVVAGGALVRAETTTSDQTLACADIVAGEGAYTPPSRESEFELEQALTHLGELNFTMYVGGDEATPAVSCPDVTYSIVVLGDGSLGEQTLSGDGPDRLFVSTPEILTTASVAGDGLTNALRFRIPVNDEDGAVCVYLTTVGTPPDGTSSNNGAAFDGGPAETLLDRAPDGGSTGSYCELIPDPEGGAGGNSYR